MRCRDSVPSSAPPSARCASTSSSACIAAAPSPRASASRAMPAAASKRIGSSFATAIAWARSKAAAAASVRPRECSTAAICEQPRQLGLDVLHRERGLQRRLCQRHRRLGVAVAQRDHRQVGLRIGLHHPVVGSARQAQAFLEVLARLRLLARAEQRNAEVEPGHRLRRDIAHVAEQLPLLPAQLEVAGEVVEPDRDQRQGVEKAALDPTQPVRPGRGQAVERQRPARRHVAEIAEARGHQVLRAQLQLDVAGALGPVSRPARGIHLGVAVGGAHRVGAAPLGRIGAPPVVVQRSASASQRFDVGALLGAPPLQVQRALAHLEQPPAKPHRLGRGVVSEQRQRARHVVGHRFVREAVWRRARRRGRRIRRRAGCRRPSRSARPSAPRKSLARAPVRPASHAAALAWQSRRGRLSTVS